jgi:hypothetical protein
MRMIIVMTNPQPAWKFWHPMPWWQVLLVLLAAQIVTTIPSVALREGLGVPVPTWIASGIGGMLGWIAIIAIVRRRNAQRSSDESSLNRPR